MAMITGSGGAARTITVAATTTAGISGEAEVEAAASIAIAKAEVMMDSSDDEKYHGFVSGGCSKIRRGFQDLKRD